MGIDFLINYVVNYIIAQQFVIDLNLALNIIQGVGFPIVIWIGHKIVQVHRITKLNSYKNDALVAVLSSQFGNGEFKKNFEQELNRKLDQYKFIYKG